MYSEADAESAHVSQADEAVCLGDGAGGAHLPGWSTRSSPWRRDTAQAIHPGYGFLSENAGFAEACEAAGIAFIGPTPAQLRAFGLKHTARALAEQHGVPMLEGTGLLDGLDAALAGRRRRSATR